jgi:hypothetical protein
LSHVAGAHIIDNIRTCQDIDDRNSLSAAARAARPAHPVGELVFTVEALGVVVEDMMGTTNNPCLSQRLQ